MEKENNGMDITYLAEELQVFFQKRLKLVAENKYPLTLAADPPSRFTIHVVPENYDEIFLNIKKLERPENYFIPYADNLDTTLAEFNFDGVLFHTTAHDKRAYTQVFRNGILETVVAIAQVDVNGKRNVIFPLRLEERLTNMLTTHLALYHRLCIPGPYYLYFRMLAVENIRIDTADLVKVGLDAKGRNKPLIQNELHFPPYQLEHAEINVRRNLTPFLDILWNSFGFCGAPTNP